MTLETKTNLNDKTIEMVQKLIRINIDSRDGFKEVADKTDDAPLKAMFEEFAEQRDSHVNELQTLIHANCEEPRDTGSYAAAAHRTLIDIRAALGGGTHVMLIEAERGEDQIKEAYEDALKDNPATAVSDVLHRQYEAVKSAHDRIRDLRDLHKDNDGEDKSDSDK